jgi:hypothetical protein
MLYIQILPYASSYSTISLNMSLISKFPFLYNLEDNFKGFRINRDLPPEGI